MKVKLGSAEYTVKFVFEGPKGRRTTTVCWVNGPERNSLGIAKLHPSDAHKFSRSSGRKLALSKALGTYKRRPDEEPTYPKEVRNAIWAEYFRYCSSEGVTPNQD